MTDPTRTLEDALMSLIYDWPDLQNITPTAGKVTGGKGSPKKRERLAPPIPGGTTRMSLIEEAHAAVTSWCMVVLDGRDLTGGNVGEDTADRADFLLTHAEWLGARSTEAGDELSEIARRIHAAVAPSGVRRIPIGACPVQDCGGAVFAPIGNGDYPDLTCDLDREHYWSEPHYQRLASLLGHDGPARMTVDELMAYLTARFSRRAPTERQVRGWIKVRPLSMGWDAYTGTVDRVMAVGVYLERRYANAA